MPNFDRSNFFSFIILNPHTLQNDIKVSTIMKKSNPDIVQYCFCIYQNDFFETVIFKKIYIFL